MWCLSRWTDGALFDLAVKIVLGAAGDELAQDFAADRGRLYLGQNWSEGLKAANAQLPHLVAQIRAPMAWLNDQLADGRRFLLGDEPAPSMPRSTMPFGSCAGAGGAVRNCCRNSANSNGGRPTCAKSDTATAPT